MVSGVGGTLPAHQGRQSGWPHDWTLMSERLHLGYQVPWRSGLGLGWGVLQHGCQGKSPSQTLQARFPANPFHVYVKMLFEREKQSM